MRRLGPLLIGVLLLASPAPARETAEPVVVELFTAQGCAECLQANDLVMELAETPEVIALTYSVDYWDYLGWRDTFARPEFAERQSAYKTAMNLRDVYTPQIVVDGKRQLAGVERELVQEVVREEAEARRWPPEMMFQGEDRVAVGSGRPPRGGAGVWLVRYETEAQEVQVRRGENRGQTVRQGNVVRELVRLGDWKGRPKLYRIPESENPELGAVVILQAERTGHILGAVRR